MHPTSAARSVSSQCWAGFDANTASSTSASAASLVARDACVGEAGVDRQVRLIRQSGTQRRPVRAEYGAAR